MSRSTSTTTSTHRHHHHDTTSPSTTASTSTPTSTSTSASSPSPSASATTTTTTSSTSTSATSSSSSAGGKYRGQGGGGVGVSSGGGRRHPTTRKLVRDKVFMVTSPALRRLARKAGITRMADDAIWVTRGALFTFVTHVTRDALAYCDFAQRKTVMVSDVLYALKRQGQTVYGFGL